MKEKIDRICDLLDELNSFSGREYLKENGFRIASENAVLVTNLFSVCEELGVTPMKTKHTYTNEWDGVTSVKYEAFYRGYKLIEFIPVEAEE